MRPQREKPKDLQRRIKFQAKVMATTDRQELEDLRRKLEKKGKRFHYEWRFVQQRLDELGREERP